MKKHNKSRVTKRKKNRFWIIISAMLISVAISFNVFYPVAQIDDDHTEIIKLATMLKDEDFSIERSKEILHNSYKNYYVGSTHNEIIIGVYQSNDKFYIIERIQFN